MPYRPAIFNTSINTRHHTGNEFDATHVSTDFVPSWRTYGGQSGGAYVRAYVQADGSLSLTVCEWYQQYANSVKNGTTRDVQKVVMPTLDPVAARALRDWLNAAYPPLDTSDCIGANPMRDALILARAAIMTSRPVYVAGLSTTVQHENRRAALAAINKALKE